MISPIYRANYYYTASNTNFRGKQSTIPKLQKTIQDFSFKIAESSSEELDIPTKMIPNISPKVTSVKIQQLNPDGENILYGQKGLRLVLNAEEGGASATSKSILKKGPISEIQNYLHNEQTFTAILEKIETISKILLERPDY